MKKFRTDYRLIWIPLVCFVVITYGLLIGKLGIYWDDWAYTWTRLELGFHGLLRHFSFSRPVAGQIHNLAILATDGSPLKIQIWGLIFQVLGSFCIGWLVRSTWKDSDFAAAHCALLFLAYPGFSMQPIAINFAFSYFLIGILCISFILSLKANRDPRRRILLTVIAMGLAALNLFASEYFFLLELLRPVLFWCEDAERENSGFKERLKRVIRWEIPYLFVFLAGVVYRMFFHKTQTLHYEFRLVTELKTNPLHGLLLWLGEMLKDCRRVLVDAWLLIFDFPDIESFGQKSTLTYIAICLAVFVIVLLFLLLMRKQRSVKASVGMIILGILGMVFGGQPYWLTESHVNFVFPNCRYTLSFMLGISLVVTGLLTLISRPKWLSALIAALMVGLAAGNHFVNTNAYRRDWTLTKDFFTQLSWRIPAIEENTVVVSNVLPIRFSTDNSLTAPLNWIFADGYETDEMPYMLYTNTKRENTLSGFESGNEITQEYLSARFHGNTDDMISIYYNTPGCVHVLDPEVDVFNQTIPELDRNAALLNNYSRILTDGEPHPLPVKLFGAETGKNWCWYYETADLARQRKDWKTVTELGDEGFAGTDHPNDPMERLPFIEGYAHVDRWEDALSQTRETLAVTPVMNDPLCALWARIDRETEPAEAKTTVLTEISGMLSCEFLK